MADTLADRALQLLAADSQLGGLITYGFRLEADGRRIPPHGALTGYQSPWGYMPGMLDANGRLLADLDLLGPSALGLLTQRLDAGGCTLVASCTAPPWAHLAERVAFLAVDAPYRRPAPGPVIGVDEAIRVIAEAAHRLGIIGHRTTWFALRAAQAAAKLDGRRRLRTDDIAEAIALVLAPRAQVQEDLQPDERPEPERQEQQQEEAEAPIQPVPMPPLPAPPVRIRPSLHGAPIRTVPGRHRQGTLNLTATLLASLPWQRLRGRSGFPPAIRPADLRWHLRRPRQGRLIIFAVDSSGSMGARRLGQAKGAVLKLLQEAYRRRDQVALIAASGKEPRLLLPPARAVEQARRHLVSLPAGGATPLSGALLQARHLAVQAKRRDGRPTLLLLLTDGRANQPLPGRDRAAVRDELQRSALAVRAAQINSLVLGQPGKEALELAHWLGGGFQVIGRRDLTKALQRD